MRPPEIQGFLVCEDIRRDQYGRDLLIGVFTPQGLFFPSFPFNTRIAIHIAYAPTTAGLFKFFLRVSYNGHEPFPLTVEGETPDLKLVHIGITDMALRGTAAGDALWEFSRDEKEWQELYRLPVSHGTVATNPLSPTYKS